MSALGVDIHDCGSENRDAVHVGELPLETPRERDIVGVEARDVAPLRALQSAIARRCATP